MNTVTDLRVSEVLRRAREALIWCGWTQGDFVNEQGEICTDGALRYAITDQPDTLRQDITSARRAALSAAEDLLMRVVGLEEQEVEPGPGYALVDWNDEPGRTEDEVLAVLIEAERQARAAETAVSS